jgi:hypothetical protein
VALGHRACHGKNQNKWCHSSVTVVVQLWNRCGTVVSQQCYSGVRRRRCSRTPSFQRLSQHNRHSLTPKPLLSDIITVSLLLRDGSRTPSLPRLSHCCYIVVTLSLHCCYPAVTMLSHCCHTVVTLLLHCSHIVITLSLDYHHTITTLSSHYHHTFITLLEKASFLHRFAPKENSRFPAV